METVKEWGNWAVDQGKSLLHTLKWDSWDSFKNEGGWRMLPAIPAAILGFKYTLAGVGSAVGGGTFSMIAALPLAVVGGMVAARYTPDIIEWGYDKVKGVIPGGDSAVSETAVAEAPASRRTARDVAMARGSEEVSYDVAAADIGDLPPPPGKHPGRPVSRV